MENLQIKYQLNSLVLRNKKEFVRLEATNEDDFAQICLNKGDVIDVIKHLAEWAGIDLPSELNTKALPLHGVSPSFNKEDLGTVYQIGFNHGKHVAPFQKDKVVEAFCTADNVTDFKNEIKEHFREQN